MGTPAQLGEVQQHKCREILQSGVALLTTAAMHPPPFVCPARQKTNWLYELEMQKSSTAYFSRMEGNTAT